MKRIILLALCLMLAVALPQPVFAAGETITGADTDGGVMIEENKDTSKAPALDAKDISSDHWAKKAIETLNDHKVMLGYQGLFRPNDRMTRAEYFALINRAFGYFKKGETSSFKDSGNNPNHWKDVEIMKAAYQGYLKGSNSYAFPDREITREEAMAILSRVLRQEPVADGPPFSDGGEVSAWAKPLIAALWKEGYIQGNGGKLNPKTSITRAETAQLLCNSIGELLDKGSLYDMENKVLGHVTISASDVVLKNAVIKGNLYITESVGDGAVTLDNVKVEGRTVIAGGGVHSVIIINTALGRAVIDVPDGAAVRFAAQGNSSVDSVMVFSDSIIDATGSQVGIESVVIAIPEGGSVDLNGSFSMVEIETSSITVNARDGAIDQLIVADTALDAEVNLHHTASVGLLVCDAQSQILGGGQINSAIINVNDVTLEQRPESLTMPRGIGAEVEGQTLNSGYSGTAGASADGGSSGSSGGGSEEEKTYTLSASSNPPDSASIAGAGIYKPGASATLTAAPAAGWGFRNWTVDGKVVGTKPKLVYVMPERDVTVTVNLVPLYTLTVTASGSGDVTPKEPQKYPAATVFTVTAKAKGGSIFSHWTIGGETVSVEESFTYFMPYGDLLVTAVFLPAETVTQWDGTINSTVPTALKDGAYLISNGSQLAWIAAEVNAGNDFDKVKFTLQNNINMNNLPWTPIGDLEREFNGIFNGNGKTISNLSVDVSESGGSALLSGLFGHIGRKGKVQKLNLENVSIEAAYPSYPTEDKFCYAGAMAGINDGEIKNCEIRSGSITAGNARAVFAGGVAGWNRLGTIKGCFNLASIESVITEETERTDAVSGGIAGENYSTIESCFNEGGIRSECEDGCYAGGITGYTFKCVIKDCFNNGAVSAEGKNLASAGGTAGSCNSLSKISTCYNTGEITAQIAEEDSSEDTIEAAGGIVGALAGEDENMVKDCYYLDTSADEGIGYFEDSSPPGAPVAGPLESFSSEAFFANFDFEKKWYFQPDGGYPYPHLREFLKVYKLTLKAVPSKSGKSGGTAIVEDGAGDKFMPGALVSLKATANDGYDFLNWTVNGEIVSEQSEFTYMMPARNVTVHANFTAPTPELYALYLSAEPAGSGTAVGAGTYYAGNTVRLKAQPTEGSEFRYWARAEEEDVQEIGTDAETDYVMPAEDTQLIAVFAQVLTIGDNYKLTCEVNPSGGGTVAVKPPVGQADGETTAGMEYQFTASPEEGYEFVNWTVNGEDQGSDPVLRLTAPDEDVTVVANFKAIVYYTLRIVSSDTAGGTACAGDDETELSLRDGEKIWLDATANDGFVFTQWTIGGNAVSSRNPFEYTMPPEDVTIAAIFVEWNADMGYPLTVETNSSARGRAYVDYPVADDNFFPEWERIYLKATPYTGFEFECWSVDGETVGTDSAIEFVMPGKAVTITASFKLLPPPVGVDTALDFARYQIWDFATDGDSCFVGVGEKGTVIRSADGGSTWVQAWSGVDADAVAYGCGKFIAIGDDNIASSEDGVHWENINHLMPEMPGMQDYRDIAYGSFKDSESMFVVTDGYTVWTSVDGEEWDAASLGVSDGFAEAVEFGDGRCVMVGLNAFLYSDNGGTWIETLEEHENFHFWSLAYGNGKFVAGGDIQELVSEDGANWELWNWNIVTDSMVVPDGEPYFESANTRYLSFTDGLFFAPYGDFYFTSSDGAHYTEHMHDIPLGGAGSHFGKGAGNLFLVTGDYGQLLISRDQCATWQEVIPQNPYYISDYFQDGEAQIFSGELLSLHHSDFGTLPAGMVITSTDGSDLKRYTLIPPEPLTGLKGAIHATASNGEIYAAVGGVDNTLASEDDPGYGYRSVIYHSNDAGGWYPAEFAIPYMLKDIVYNPDEELFAAVGTDGTGGIILTSADGQAWSEIKTDTALNTIGWDSDAGLIAGGDGGKIYLSKDGADWSSKEIENLEKVTQIEGNVVAGNLLGVVNSNHSFTTYAILEEEEMFTAVTTDENEYIHAVRTGGVVSVYDGNDWVDTDMECLADIKKIIVTNENPVNQALNKLLYCDSATLIKHVHGNCGCRVDRGAFTSGNGSESNPFVVSSLKQLEHIRRHASQGYAYKLIADITLPELWTPIGDYSYSDPDIDPFNGIFDGNGHTIDVSDVSFPAGRGNCGLFGAIDEQGVVENLSIYTIGSDVEVVVNTGMMAIGAISGENYGSIMNCEVSGDFSVLCSDETALSMGMLTAANFGMVKNCRAFGEIHVISTGYDADVGGIAGYNEGIISQSVNNADLIITASDETDLYIGGIAGRNMGFDSDARIEDCYNTGTIEVAGSDDASGANWRAGGIAGGNYWDSSILTSYNTGTIIVDCASGEEPEPLPPIGGISGSNEGIISCCYYLEGSAPVGVGGKEPGDPDNTGNAKKLTEGQMKVQESFTGFDFENIWGIFAGEYPFPSFQ